MRDTKALSGVRRRTADVRILQLHTRYRQAGGEDAAVDAQGALLREAGHGVELLDFENPRDVAASARAFAQAPWNPSSASVVRNAVSRTQPDIVHVHNTWFAMSPSVLDAVAGERAGVVMSLHNYRLSCSNSYLFRDGNPCQDCVGSHPWHGVRHACYQGSRAKSAVAATTIALHRRRQTYQNAVDVFVATTPFARGRFEAAGLPAERIVVQPHFVPDPGKRPAPPSASRDLLFVGRLSPEKGLDVVLRALALIGGQSSLRLTVVGNGPHRHEFERLAGDRVRFLGHQSPEAVRQLMLSARGLLFPSLCYETFGLSLVEGMAAGLPAVASALGGSEWIVPHGAGRLVPPGDVPAWASALRELELDDVVDRRGTAARECWRNRFSPAIGLEGLERAYEQAVTRRQGRAQ